MTMAHHAPILATLRERPDGTTAKQLAVLLQWRVTKASLYLGRMFFSGELSRRGNQDPSRIANEYVYTISPLPPVPSPARGTWKPPVTRIADRITDHPRAKAIAMLAAEADRLLEGMGG